MMNTTHHPVYQEKMKNTLAWCTEKRKALDWKMIYTDFSCKYIPQISGIINKQKWYEECVNVQTKQYLLSNLCIWIYLGKERHPLRLNLSREYVCLRLFSLTLKAWKIPWLYMTIDWNSLQHELNPQNQTDHALNLICWWQFNYCFG